MSGSTGAVGAADASGPGANGLLERIRNAFDVLRFRTDAVDTALADTGAFPHALAIVALAGVAEAVGRSASLPGVLAAAVAHVLGSLLLAGAIHLGARLVLGARQDFVRFYRALGLTYLLFWAVGIPIVHALFRWVLWAWQIAAVVLVTERAYRIDRVQAAFAVALTVLSGLVLLLILNSIRALAMLVTGALF